MSPGGSAALGLALLCSWWSRGEEHQMPLQQRLRLIKDFSSVWHYPAPLEKPGLLGDLSATTTSAHRCRSLLRNNLGSPAGSAELSIPCSPPHPVTEVALPKGVKDHALQDQTRNASMESLSWGSAGTAAFKRHQLFYHKRQFLIPNPNTKQQSEAH